jgi:UDP-N-acetylmuramoyl-L-alanyl-D-glutamate--2,6-diaminopimelate ligase
LHLTELTDEPVTNPAEVDIAGLTADSRAVERGWLFAALKGAQSDGLDFVDHAVRRGAAAVLSRPDPRLARLSLPVVVSSRPRRSFARMAARFYGLDPAAVMVAVTGTNGKSSVVDFCRQIWTTLGERGASLGTLGVVGPAGTRPLAHTSPDPVVLHENLRRLFDERVTHVALEASSHGLDQDRLDGVPIAAAAFTSFSRDHLDYHVDAAAYLAAKRRLFDELLDVNGTAVVNAAADSADEIVAAARRRGARVWRYGAPADCELRLLERTPHDDGQLLDLDILGRRARLDLPLVGHFQADNALAALGLAIAGGAERDAAIAALGGLRGVRGRLELAARRANGGRVFVDYAHTPDALVHALRALRPHTAGRLICAFGCGGDRDPGKRPLMARAVAENADVGILTDDNPRTEDPAKIRAAALAGAPDAIEIGDRAAAIAAGVDMLGADDVFLIAGKGHEQGQIVGREVRPFDDAGVARAAVAAKERAA